MRTETKGALLVLLAGSLWGLSGFFVTILSRMGSNPAVTGLFRLGFGFVFLLVASLLLYGPAAFLIDRRTLLFSFLLGLISIGLNTWVHTLSILLNGMSAAVILINLAPVFTLVWSMLFFSELPPSRQWLAIALNLSGCALAVTGGEAARFFTGWPGLLYGVAAGVTYSLSPIFGRYATQNTPPVIVSCYSFFFAVLFLALFSGPGAQPVPLTGTLLVTGAFYALLTACAFVSYYAGVRRIKKSSRVPILASVEIVMAVGVGVLFFGEDLRPVHLLGIALLFFSIVLMRPQTEVSNS